MITVDAVGLDSLPTGGTGVELQHPGAFRVRDSHGIWVDANGPRTAVPARFDGGHILLIVPAAVVNASGFPATLDPEIVVDPLSLISARSRSPELDTQFRHIVLDEYCVETAARERCKVRRVDSAGPSRVRTDHIQAGVWVWSCINVRAGDLRSGGTQHCRLPGSA